MPLPETGIRNPLKQKPPENIPGALCFWGPATAGASPFRRGSSRSWGSVSPSRSAPVGRRHTRGRSLSRHLMLFLISAQSHHSLVSWSQNRSFRPEQGVNPALGRVFLPNHRKGGAVNLVGVHQKDQVVHRAHPRLGRFLDRRHQF